MSRFFAVVSSESESESDSSGDEGQVLPQRGVVAGVRALQFSDDEDDTRRVVRSEKEKRYDELKDIIKRMKNYKKIKDMSNVLSDFENLTKAYEKAKKVVEKEGMPRFYLRSLVELEDFVIECWEDREGRKAMSKNNAKGLTNLRQKLKKYLRNFEGEVKAYRENPDAEEEDKSDMSDDDQSESDSDSDSDLPYMKPKQSASDAVPKKSKLMQDSDSEGDYDSWEEDRGEEESSSDEEEHVSKFMREPEDKEKTGDVGKKRRKKEERRKREMQEADGDEGGEWEEVKGGVPMAMPEKPKMFAKDAEITHEAVVKKLFEIIAARGKKGTDRTEQIELLIELEEISQTNNLGPAISIKILFHVIAAIFDYNPNIATCMRGELWNKCLKYLIVTLTKLEENPDITIGENISDDSEVLEESPYRVRGCILTMLERMDEEFTKMLQACDAHSTDYVERLKDEQAVCDLIKRVQLYTEKDGHSGMICRVYQRRVEHLYYKFDHVHATMKKNKENNEPVNIPEGYEDSAKVMDRLCKYIYTHDTTDRIRTRAILCHIYHHGLHDRWFEARDLMLMSHLQDTIHHSDVPTQIMYNRAMVQLGLCAFRQGMVKDAHNALVDIQSGGRAKELLAQGLLLQRQHERTPEQEKIEKRRQMPYHMHINLELLECVYLVSAMLLEIPYMAAHELDARRRMISKNFHHVLRLSERQPLVGPPESMREHVVAASKAMKTGDWRACKNYIINEKMNSKVWDLFFQATRVRDMITQKIQEESLRTYLFTYSSVYDSISLVTLAEMFELEKGTVHSIISKMIINEELMASLDQPTQSVVMHRTEPTRLQALALQLSEKVTSLVENNERIVEMKQGNFFYQNKQGKDFNYQNKQGNYGNKEGGYRGGGKGGYRMNKDGYQGRGRHHYDRDHGHGWGNKSYEGRNRGGQRTQRAY